MSLPRQLPGERDPKFLIVTDGVRFEVLELEMVGETTAAVNMPEWPTLCWLLHDDPRYRPDWNRTVGYKPETFDKLSKSG